ncbi:MAG: hypothetical protein K9J27_12735 [Bacteroidales bacterium]|nr:hypothetical protein [Bacteroidales bacterium]MCF8334867.1 hypothetical protein [Bacteroidales bacterium]
MPKLNKSFANVLLRMRQGGTLKASEITDKKALQRFIEDGIIKKVPVGGRRYQYVVDSPDALIHYLAVNYQVHSLERYLDLFDREFVSGEEALQATYSTKTRRSHVMSGFFMESTEPVELRYGSETLKLPAPNDAGIFLFSPQKLDIPRHITIVGVENPEVFRKIRRLSACFTNYQPCLFVLRYMSKGLVSWLQQIPNSYLHFGDFDPAGLALYINEYRANLQESRCRFFVPQDIEESIRNYGNRELYEKQYNATRNLDFQAYPEIAPLASMIKKHRKGLEQEILLQDRIC